MTSFDVTKIENRTTLWVDSERTDECLAYFRSQRIDTLGINPVRGYKEKNLDFLLDARDISRLHVVFPAAFQFEMQPVLALSGLQSLIVSEKIDLDLSQFSQLDEFRGIWNGNLQLDKCAKLKKLYLIGYKSVTNDLASFPLLPMLVELALVQSSITSLAGINRLLKLRRLELAYLSKLEMLEPVTSLPILEVLDVSKCRKLKNHEIVRSLSNLRILRFNDCGVIPNLNFIRDMPQLEEFRFVNTNIEDGNLAPLLALKRVGFLPKKHYTHRPENFGKSNGSPISRPASSE